MYKGLPVSLHVRKKLIFLVIALLVVNREFLLQIVERLMIAFELLANKQTQYPLDSACRSVLSLSHHSQYFLSLLYDAELVQLRQPFTAANQ